MEINRPVVIKRMPERLNSRQARAFWQEVRPLVTADRPQLVFDMSPLKYLDAGGIDILLKCMSEAMRRDGDLKLAALRPEAAVILEMTRVDRFFEVYETPTDAMRSFSRFLPSTMRQQPFGKPEAARAADDNKTELAA
jgi:anti-sigma B factor antagonist